MVGGRRPRKAYVRWIGRPSQDRQPVRSGLPQLTHPAAQLTDWIATQLAAAVLITVSLAFLMHITASVLTRSAMPGLATSILPGLPGVVMLLTYIWTR